MAEVVGGTVVVAEMVSARCYDWRQLMTDTVICIACVAGNGCFNACKCVCS